MSQKVNLNDARLPNEISKMKNETILFSKWINKISTKRRLNRRLLIITDWEFFLLKKKMFSKKFILSCNFRWFDITIIESNEKHPNEFTIFFQLPRKNLNINQKIQNKNMKKRNNLSFKYEKTSKMLKMFYKYLISFQLPNDLPEFKYPSSFTFPNAKGSIINHLKMKSRFNNIHVSKSFLDSLERFISTRPNEFCFTEFHDLINKLPIFLESIYFVPSIQTLIIPFRARFNILQILIDFLNDNQTITSIIFKEKLPYNFIDFTNSFLSSESSNIIQSFAFINSRFTKQNVDDLSEIVQNKNIINLQLINSLGPHTFPLFFEKVFKNSGFFNIKILSINKIYSFNIKIVLPYFKNISSLSLVNNNEKQIFNRIKFPKFLNDLVLKDIQWEVTSLVIFLESLMHHTSELKETNLQNDEIKIDLSHIKMTENEWDLFYEKIKFIKCENIVEFKWNDNKISNQLVLFIKSFNNLKTLSLNGITYNKNDDLQSLLQFIANSNKLQYLSFSGTKSRNIGKQILAVIDILYINRSIKYIDISNHNCGNSILSKLADALIHNRIVEDIIFFPNSITDIVLFHSFLEKMAKRGTKLYTEYPKKFIKSMYQYGMIQNDEIEQIKKLYNMMLKGNQDINIPVSSIKSKSNQKFILKNYIDNVNQSKLIKRKHNFTKIKI